MITICTALVINLKSQMEAYDMNPRPCIGSHDFLALDTANHLFQLLRREGLAFRVQGLLPCLTIACCRETELKSTESMEPCPPQNPPNRASSTFPLYNMQSNFARKRSQSSLAVKGIQKSQKCGGPSLKSKFIGIPGHVISWKKYGNKYMVDSLCNKLVEKSTGLIHSFRFYGW